MDAKRIGILAILGASVMWALEPIAVKLSYQNADILETATLRALVATLIAVIYMVVTRGTPLTITRRQIPLLFYLAIVGTLLADLIYLYALTTIPVTNAALIGHMQPLFIILLGFFILQEEKLTGYDYGGILAMILAGILVSTGTLTNLLSLKFGTLGDALVLVATLAWATAALVMKKYLSGVHAGVITFYRFLIATVVLGLYLTVTHSLALSNLYQVLVGIIVGIGTLLYYEALRRIKAAQVSALELATPFYAAILGFFILGEPVTSLQVTSILLLVLGILLLSRKDTPLPRPSPDVSRRQR